MIYLGIVAISALSFGAAQQGLGQSQPQASQDAFQRRVGGLTLDGQTIGDALASLSQATGVAFSVEFPLGKTFTDASPPLKNIVAQVGPGTVPEILDQLCELDTTFTWRRIGNTANIFPSALANDPNYVLNRRVSLLTFKDVRDAQEAVFGAVDQLLGSKEQIAMLETGASVTFAKPWTATFREITIREAFDQIAQQFGSTYGWQFGGATDFRIITFHQRMAAKAKHAAR